MERAPLRREAAARPDREAAHSRDGRASDDQSQQDLRAQLVRPRAPKAMIEQRDASPVRLGPDPLLIGRDPQNDVVLDDRRVSRKHAEIRLRLGRYTLYDLQSTNGTYVNGRRVAEKVLDDGDKI